jgi:hypothetical protein
LAGGDLCCSPVSILKQLLLYCSDAFGVACTMRSPCLGADQGLSSVYLQAPLLCCICGCSSCCTGCVETQCLQCCSVGMLSQLEAACRCRCRLSSAQCSAGTVPVSRGVYHDHQCACTGCACNIMWFFNSHALRYIQLDQCVWYVPTTCSLSPWAASCSSRHCVTR